MAPTTPAGTDANKMDREVKGENQPREIDRSDCNDPAGRLAKPAATDKAVASSAAAADVATTGATAADVALESPVCADATTDDSACGRCLVSECDGSAEGQVIQLATDDDGEAVAREEEEEEVKEVEELGKDATSAREPDLVSQLKSLTLSEPADNVSGDAIPCGGSRDCNADLPAAAASDDDGGELTSHGPQNGRPVMSSYGRAVAGQQQQIMHAIYRPSDGYYSPFGTSSGVVAAPQMKRSVPVEIDETNLQLTADLTSKYRFDGPTQTGARDEAAYDGKFTDDLASWLDEEPSTPLESLQQQLQQQQLLLQQQQQQLLQQQLQQQQLQQQTRSRYGSVTTASESSWDSVDSPCSTIGTASSPASSCDSSAGQLAGCGYGDETAAECSPQSWPPSPLSSSQCGGLPLPLQQLRQLPSQRQSHTSYTSQKWPASPAAPASVRSSSSSSSRSSSSASAQPCTNGSVSGGCLTYPGGFGYVDAASGACRDAQVPATSPVSVFSDTCTLYSEPGPGGYYESGSKQQPQQQQQQQQQAGSRLDEATLDDEFDLIDEALAAVEGKSQHGCVADVLLSRQQPPPLQNLMAPQHSYPQQQELYLSQQQKQQPSLPSQQSRMSVQQLSQLPTMIQQQQLQQQLQEQHQNPRFVYHPPSAPAALLPAISTPMHVPVTTVNLSPTMSPSAPAAPGSLLIVIPSPPVQPVAAQPQLQQQQQRHGKKERPILPAPPSDSGSASGSGAMVPGRSSSSSTSASTVAVASNIVKRNGKPQEKADAPNPKPSGPASEQRLLAARRVIAAIPDGDLRLQDADGNTYLHRVVIKPDAYMVRAILERLYRSESIRGMVNLTNKAGQTAVYLATMRNHSVIVKLLVQCHAEVNIHAQCPEFQAPLHYAASNGERTLEVLSCLLKARFVDVNIKTGSSSRTPLHCAVFSHGRADPETNRPVNAIPTVRALLAANARLDLQDEPDGRTPLHYAVSNGCFELVQEIVAAASVPAVDAALRAATRQNDTCLHLAAASRPSSLPAVMDRTSILRLLLKHGARTAAYNLRRQRPADLLSQTDDPELRRLME